MKRYTLTDIGCYADATFGHQHCRERLGSLAAVNLRDPSKWFNGLLRSLRGPMPEDAHDELATLALLNEHACDEESVHFEFCDGNLCLVATPAKEATEKP